METNSEIAQCWRQQPERSARVYFPISPRNPESEQEQFRPNPPVRVRNNFTEGLGFE